LAWKLIEVFTKLRQHAGAFVGCDEMKAAMKCQKTEVNSSNCDLLCNYTGM
jgi:hypothetical protein